MEAAEKGAGELYEKPEVRIAVLEDIERLTELLVSLFTGEEEFSPHPERQREGLHLIISDPAVGEILVLEADGRIIGMLSLLYTVSTFMGGRAALLEDMIIDPAFRGQGLGSLLLSEAIAYAKQGGCLRVTLLTDSGNIGAQRYYQKQGFEKSPMIPMRLSLR